MNGNRLLADTNILLYFLKGNLEIIEILKDKSLVISFISELELLSFSGISNESENIIKGFLKNCTIIDLNPEIKDLTIEFRKKAKLKLPDSIIAATAFYFKLPLMTADKQFRMIEELDLIFYEV